MLLIIICRAKDKHAPNWKLSKFYNFLLETQKVCDRLEPALAHRFRSQSSTSKPNIPNSLTGEARTADGGRSARVAQQLRGDPDERPPQSDRLHQLPHGSGSVGVRAKLCDNLPRHDATTQPLLHCHLSQHVHTSSHCCFYMYMYVQTL